MTTSKNWAAEVERWLASLEERQRITETWLQKTTAVLVDRLRDLNSMMALDLLGGYVSGAAGGTPAPTPSAILVPAGPGLIRSRRAGSPSSASESDGYGGSGDAPDEPEDTED